MKKGIITVLLAVLLLLTACGKNKDIISEDGRIVLTLGVVSANENLRREVQLYNQSNSEYMIEIKSYMDSSSAETDAVNKIQMEIAAGGGPDIIDFGYYYSPMVAGKGITEDLAVYMEADEDFHEEDYFMNVIEALSGNEKLYVISPQFSIQTIAGRQADFKDTINWTVQDIIPYFEGDVQERALFYGNSRKEVFGGLCMGCMGDFVNWADGTCSFDDGAFKELVMFADRFPDPMFYDEDCSALEQLQTGKVLLFHASITDVYETAQVRIILGDVPVNYVGYPLGERNGNIVSIGKTVLGINKNSNHKEAAWGFIKRFFGEEYQSSIEGGLPLLKSELDRRLQKAQEIEYEQNAYGEKQEIVKASIIFEGEEPIDITCINEQDAEDLLKIINSVDTAYAGDIDLYSIVLEEMAYYFEGNRDIDSVIEIIQSRASIFVSENH